MILDLDKFDAWNLWLDGHIIVSFPHFSNVRMCHWRLIVFVSCVNLVRLWNHMIGTAVSCNLLWPCGMYFWDFSVCTLVPSVGSVCWKAEIVYCKSRFPRKWGKCKIFSVFATFGLLHFIFISVLYFFKILLLPIIESIWLNIIMHSIICKYPIPKHLYLVYWKCMDKTSTLLVFFVYLMLRAISTSMPQMS